MLKFKTYNIENISITNEVLSIYLTNFWNDIYKPLISKVVNKHLLILIKIQFSNGDHRSIGQSRLVNYNERLLYLEYLSETLSILSDSYSVNPISKIIFSYIIKDGEATESNRRLINNLSVSETPKHRFNNMELPITMDIKKYGTIRSIQLLDNCTRYIIHNLKRIFEVDVNLDGLTNNVRILGASDLKWKDTRRSEGGFIREIGKSTIYFNEEGEIILRKQVLPAKPFKRTKLDSKLLTKFVTMDIETIQKDGKIVPYLACAYNGSKTIKSFSENQNELFTRKAVFMDGLLTFFTKRTKLLTVYAHNFSGFDGIHLMRHLLNYGIVEPLLFNGKLYSIKLKLKNGKTIIFKDSMLLLPLSLRKLCKAFGIEIGKGYFPFLLSNIWYSGVLPAFKYWTNIDFTEYTQIKLENKNKFWSFKIRAEEYCEQDCIVLHQVLVKFNELIFNKFQINIHSVLTLPALAMRIYKSHYMKDDTIYQLVGKVEQAIRQSYSGGSVDVYIPHSKQGTFVDIVSTKWISKLFYYDVNSLYPYVMANMSMPIGKPIYFEGDIRKVESKAYGYFYCEITTPDYLEHPILQRRIHTSLGIRTIAGLGNWKGWIYSKEMDNAIKFGYTFNIIKGYQFEEGDLFSSYVNTLYDLRQEYDKSHPLNMIAKLLPRSENSLYGKFGMKMEITRVDIFPIFDENDKLIFRNELEKWKEGIHDWIKLDNHNSCS